MYRLEIYFFFAFLLAGNMYLWPSSACSQGMADPLTIQGLDNEITLGVKQRSTGGILLGTGVDAMTIFNNPALLQNIESPQVQVGSNYTQRNLNQEQSWIPNRFYAELTLYFENSIEEEDRDVVFSHTHPDDIRPPWNYSKNDFRPQNIALAFPFEIGPLAMVGGIGGTEFIDLHHYFKNNNALDPNIGQIRPEPVMPRPEREDTVHIDWYQFERQRTGSIYSITPALSIQLIDGMSIAAAVNYLTGQSDDFQRRMDRGMIELRFENRFTIYPKEYSELTTGESKYSGVQYHLGWNYQLEHFSVNLNYKPSYRLKRTWDRLREIVNNEQLQLIEEEGVDYLDVPNSYGLGIAFYPLDRLSLGINYLRRSYSDLQYEPHSGEPTQPWLSTSTFSAGMILVVYNWLDLRLGFRENPQTFAPVGHSFEDQNANGSVYSVGFGISYEMITFDLVYEYSDLKYVDRWLSNRNENSISNHQIGLQAGFSF